MASRCSTSIHRKLIRLAKTYLMGTAISTSLSVRRFDAEAYVESGLDFMGLSIDGATQSVYQRFRRNGDLQLVFDNVAQTGGGEAKAGQALSGTVLELPGV